MAVSGNSAVVAMTNYSFYDYRNWKANQEERARVSYTSVDAVFQLIPVCCSCAEFIVYELTGKRFGKWHLTVK